MPGVIGIIKVHNKTITQVDILYKIYIQTVILNSERFQPNLFHSMLSWFSRYICYGVGS